MEQILFVDEEGVEILFEIIDYLEDDNNKYLLVEDEDENATVLKQNTDVEGNLIYELIDAEREFQKIALLFMENDAYDIEI
ncbi:hypothetical protein AN639_09825 [Candidatus Epulonipiscium fishelsonii]|uniref:Uncharacterized protein n=1 Tax=Candidatus Epulonipiscium fishelsonii TaxID=77094 RepID=A0ACC8XE34_9FIRM|nr:hypothetical protein AN396_03905 [Epulopiscium sp. SCG-B11WGA-EpuloA1]ONI43803.1 hypothetical protein AN639_09825 [Epulopiscium sp. SCG-B05WGA-EpuloA1]